MSFCNVDTHLLFVMTMLNVGRCWKVNRKVVYDYIDATLFLLQVDPLSSRNRKH